MNLFIGLIVWVGDPGSDPDPDPDPDRSPYWVAVLDCDIGSRMLDYNTAPNFYVIFIILDYNKAIALYFRCCKAIHRT